MAWKGKATLRVKVFLWCVLRGKILTRCSLRHKGLLSKEVDVSCVICGAFEESGSPFLQMFIF